MIKGLGAEGCMRRSVNNNPAWWQWELLLHPLFPFPPLSLPFSWCHCRTQLWITATLCFSLGCLFFGAGAIKSNSCDVKTHLGRFQDLVWQDHLCKAPCDINKKLKPQKNLPHVFLVQLVGSAAEWKTTLSSVLMSRKVMLQNGLTRAQEGQTHVFWSNLRDKVAGQCFNHEAVVSGCCFLYLSQR